MGSFDDPLVNLICKYNGQVTVDKVGKINASKPARRCEIEYFDPILAAENLHIPRRMSNIENLLEELNTHLKKSS